MLGETATHATHELSRPLSMAELKRQRLLADAVPAEEASYEGDLD